MKMPTVNVAIVGASGYSGEELVRLLLRHPHAELTAVTSRQYAGQTLAQSAFFLREWAGQGGVILLLPSLAGLGYLAWRLPRLFWIILGSALFYFYRDIAIKILLIIWIFTGFWVWVAARPAYHIGASGIVYGLAAFILASGIIRRHTGLMAMALVVVFLYGSLVWGIFPEFFPDRNISWEAHLFGMISGVILAVYYRREGPQRKVYEWELEEDEEDEEVEEDKKDGDDYWKTTSTWQ